MKIVYDTLTELKYFAHKSFVFSYSLNNNASECTVLPFVSEEFPSQVYLTAYVPNCDLVNLLDSDFLSALSLAFKSQESHRSEMDKNTTLLLFSKRPTSEPLNSLAKVQIEDDPYFFKKYVFSYTELEEKHATDYFASEKSKACFSYVSTIQNYLTNHKAFSAYKGNHINEPTYSFFIELATKVPILPLHVNTANELPTVESFMDENLTSISASGKSTGVNTTAIDHLLATDVDFKVDDLDRILTLWEESLNLSKN